MTENAKTLLFGGAALVAALVAVYVTRPVVSPVDAREEVGAMLYPDFKDPLSAGSLEILSYDKETATPKDFKVALVNNSWVIPSHENYPTDAEQQLPAAAGSLLDLKILEVKTHEKSEHEQYGVLDPDPEAKEIKSGSDGVGVKVVLDDKSGKEIMRLIIGKEDPSQAGVRFVRRAGKDTVHATKVDTGKLSTKFEDWIQPDLLKVNAWDITSVDLDNYSVDEAAGGIKEGDRLALKYDDMATENKWTLAGKEEGEELNVARLDEMKDALDDLRIVDVRRKPQGLSAELKTKEGMTLNEESLLSLQSKGFFITREGTLVSNEGDLVVGTKEGIEYVLRFGEIASDTGSAPAAGDDEKKQSRYVFISAQFNKDRIEPPQLQPLPGEEPAAQPEAEPSATGEQAPAAPESEPAATESTESPAAGACQVAEQGAAEEQPAQTTAPAEGAEVTTQAPDQIAVEAERQRIETENKRVQALYDQKVQDGEKKAQELNARFADWYYVISDDMYKKIKVTRADIIKGIDPLTGEKNTLEEFEQLKNSLPTPPAVQGESPAPEGSTDGKKE